MDINIFPRLGSNLRHARRQRHFSQEDLAHAAYVSVNHLKRIERGRTNPTVKILYKLSKTLRVKVALLFADT